MTSIEMNLVGASADGNKRLSPGINDIEFTEGDNEDNITETNTSRSSGYLASDLTTGIPTEVLGSLHNPNIDEDTPAGEALRANAEVQIKRSQVIARKMHLTSVNRLAKKALRSGIGNKRGKPPRIPPPKGEGCDNSVIYPLDSLSEVPEDSEQLSSDEEEYHDRKVDENDLKSIASHEKDESRNERITVFLSPEKKKDIVLDDPYDIILKQEYRRRRKRDSEKDSRKSYVKGKVIDRKHELYALAIAIMLGVRTSIGQTNKKMTSEKRRWLHSDDFMATEKYKFKPGGTPTTPPHQLGHTFKFKDYSPISFAYLRRLFGIDEFDFLISVCGNANFIEFISNAKSGQFFFYSSDGKFMIKTMTNAESKFLRRILPHYFRHCCQNPNTMLTKFLGMYRVKLHHLRRNVKFVIMNSVYYTDKYIQSFYDLKGSVTGRVATVGQDVKKDNDLRDMLPDSAIALEPSTRIHVREQLVADCEFMRRMKIMDYSLLIGVHHIPPKGKGLNANQDVGTTGFRFSDMRRDSVGLRDIVRSSLKGNTFLPHNSEAAVDGSVSPGRGILKKTNSAPNVFSIDEMQKDESKESEKHFAPLAMYEDGLDDDDDNSYLEGSPENLTKLVTKEQDESSKILELKREETIEKVFWPFHLLHDINGDRRSVPASVLTAGSSENAALQTMEFDCTCGKNDQVELQMAGAKVPAFTAPLSFRKDGGLMMDTTGFNTPIMFKSSTGKEHPCEGKIFYMGIIDILQQYNTRKRVEYGYHRMEGSGWQDHSCVHPDVYARRFIEFFDEYSQRDGIKKDKQSGEFSNKQADANKDNEVTSQRES